MNVTAEFQVEDMSAAGCLKSSVKLLTDHPKWNQNLSGKLSVTDINKQRLLVKLFHQKALSKPTVLGDACKLTTNRAHA